MNTPEKIQELRKAQGMTQEQLAEQLNVSRQSVSKWESGQAMPEADKLMAISDLFHVTVDYLLRPSDIDALSIKADALERQQQELKRAFRKRKRTQRFLACCAGIYLVAFAVMMLERQLSMEADFLWALFPGLTFPIIAGVVATAVAIFVWLKQARAAEDTE